MSNITSFDLETKPDTQAVREIYPYDPSKVAYGNAKSEEARAKKEKEHKENWFPKLEEKAALDPLTAEIVALGFYDGKEFDIIHGCELDIINFFWEKFLDFNHQWLAGWNCEGFDLPMIIKRSYILGVSVPANVFSSGRYFNPIFMDLMKKWCCYQYNEYAKLETVAKALNVNQPRKHAVHGKDFWKILETDQDRALSYLEDDLIETYRIGRKIAF